MNPNRAPQTTNQNTQVATTAKVSAMNLMASRLHCEPDKLLATLKATMFKNATNEEMLALVVVANTYGLDVLCKELYAFPAKGGGIVPVVSVDGWLKLLIRQPDYDGIDFEMVDGNDGLPYSCTATVYVKNRSRPVKITEYYDECKRNTEPWNNMPRRMLRNRTLCQASRMAFGFSGIYHEEEAETFIDISTPPPKKIALVANAPQESEPIPTGQATDSAQPEPVRQQQPTNASAIALEKVIIDAGFSFDQFQRWAIEGEHVKNADSLASFDDVPEADAKRLLRAKLGMLAQLAQVKGDIQT